MNINCITVDAPRFSPGTTSALLDAIATQRRLYVLGDEQFRGERFNDDSRVLEAIRSGVSEDEARTSPNACAAAALKWAAEGDYYYKFEKDYGDE